MTNDLGGCKQAKQEKQYGKRKTLYIESFYALLRYTVTAATVAAHTTSKDATTIFTHGFDVLIVIPESSRRT